MVTAASAKISIFKHRIDYLLFTSLVIVVVVIVFLRLETFTSQNATILENQHLIKESLNSSNMNTKLIIDNQKVITELSNTTQIRLENQQDIINRIDNLSHALAAHIIAARDAFNHSDGSPITLLNKTQ